MDKLTVVGIDRRNPIHACIGCDRATGWNATGYVCPVYNEPYKTYPIRTFGTCPFNRPVEKVKKGFVRVGQQKQSKN